MTKKTPKPKYRSEIAAAMHETVRGMHRLGLADKKTMRDFDVRCLTAVEELSAADIAGLREEAGVSQAIFARALNVTADYVSKIERGAKRPSGPALKLLSLIRRKGFEAIL
jgi:putative transcriptional regulator